MSVAWRQVLRRTAVDISEGDCFGWAAQLAYSWFYLSGLAILMGAQFDMALKQDAHAHD